MVVTELHLGAAHDQLVATDGEGQTWDLVLALPNRNRSLDNGCGSGSIDIGTRPTVLRNAVQSSVPGMQL